MRLNPNILLLTTSLLMTSLSACTPSGSEVTGSATAAARTEPRALATAATPPDAAQRAVTAPAWPCRATRPAAEKPSQRRARTPAGPSAP